MPVSTFEQAERLKCIVLIPTYNNAGTLRQVLESVFAYTSHILVVNDGSTDETRAILADYNSLIVVHQTQNQGKGLALRLGFKKALELGYEYAITLDSDGQHFAEDISIFLDALENNPEMIYIGARNMNQTGIPGKSSFGNKFSNFWFKLETGISLPDTQSGYRLYPIKKLSRFNWFTRKYEFEIEVLVRAAWAGLEVKSLPIQVFYASKDERISHFRPFQDFSRISVLNSILVLIALFWIKPRNFFRHISKSNPRELLRELINNPDETDNTKAISVGFGFFMGIIPIWGFQIVVGISLAQLFRLNKALVLLFSNISLPPMFPFLIWGSHFLGGFLVSNPQKLTFDKKITFEMVQSHGFQYTVGAVALALLVGFLGGLSAWMILKLKK